MIDWNHLHAMREEIGADDFEDVLNLFLDECAQAVAELSSEGSIETIAAQLHFIKGSAMNLGFAALSAHCALAEHSIGSGLVRPEDLEMARTVFGSSRNHLCAEKDERFAEIRRVSGT